MLIKDAMNCKVPPEDIEGYMLQLDGNIVVDLGDDITSTLTASSYSIASIISIIVIPPILAFRSRPPIPIAFVTPSPNLSMIVVSSWIPVPDAPMMPIEPFVTLFVNASKAVSLVRGTEVPEAVIDIDESEFYKAEDGKTIKAYYSP